jgi:peptidoglycan/LPS O-acetylase OafA/YrhL
VNDDGGRLPGLTSLRAIAALAVFSRHAAEAFSSGGHNSVFTRQGATGVSFFFLLSGFVLAWSARPDEPVRRFYRRRIARIYPAYVVMLLCTQAVVGAHTGLRPVPLLTNLFLVQSWVPAGRFFFGSDIGAWSLGCEAFFYLLFPLLFPLVRRLSVRRRRWVVAAVVLTDLAVALATRSPHQADGFGLWLVYVCPLTRLGEFVIGVALACEVREGARSPLTLRQAFLVAAAGYVAAGFVPVWLMWVSTTLVPFALLLLTVAGCDADRRPAALHHRWLQRAGAWSYAFYLVHISVVGVLRHLTAPAPGDSYPVAVGAALSVAALAGSIAAAGVLFVLVERPMDRRLRGDRTLPVSTRASSMAAA